VIVDEPWWKSTFLRWHIEKELNSPPPLGLLEGRLGKLSLTDGAFYQSTLYCPMRLQRRGDSKQQLMEPVGLLGASEPRGAVIFGQRGTGTTTVARKLFHDCLCQDRLPGGPYLPCWLVCKHLTPFSNLIEWVLEVARGEDFRAGETQFHRWLRHGPPLLLFLQLDRTDTPEEVRRGILKLMNQHERVRCVVLADRETVEVKRLLRGDDGLRFQAYEVARINRHEARDYSRKLAEELRIQAPTDVELSELLLSPPLVQLVTLFPRTSGATLASHFECLVTTMLQADDGHLGIGLDDQAVYQRVILPALGRVGAAICGMRVNERTAGGRDDTVPYALHPDTLRDLAFGPWNFPRGPDGIYPNGTFWSDGLDQMLEMEQQVCPLTDQHQKKGWSCPFLEQETQNGHTYEGFVSDLFLAYFTGVHALRYYRGWQAPSHELPDEWFTATARRLLTWPLGEQMASFIAGTLDQKALEQLLLACLTSNFLTQGREESTPARVLRGLCSWADVNFTVPRVLRANIRCREWASIRDDSLLRGEIHAILDAERDCPREFVAELVKQLRCKHLSWLRRLAPPLQPATRFQHRKWVSAICRLHGEQIVTADSSGELVWWDLETGAQKSQTFHEGPVRALAEIEGPSHTWWVVSAGDDRKVMLWSALEEDEPKIQPARHFGRATALITFANGLVVSGGEDGRLLAWRPFAKPETVKAYPAHQGAVTALRGFETWLLSAGADGRVLFWTVDGNGCLHCPDPDRITMAEPGSITVLESNGNTIAWGTSAGRVFLRWKNESQPPHDVHTTEVSALAVKEDYAMSGGDDGRLVIYRHQSWDSKWHLRHEWCEGSSIRALLACQQGFVYGLADGSVKYVRPSEGSRSRAPVGRHPRALGLLACVAQDRGPARVVTGGERTVQVWKVAATELESRTAAQEVHDVEVTAVWTNGSIHASGDSDGKVILQRPNDPIIRVWPTHHKKAVKVICGHGNRIVTGGEEGKVCIWEWDSERPSLRAAWKGAPVEALWTDGEFAVWGGVGGELCCARIGGGVTSRPVGEKITALDARKVGAGYHVLVASEGAGLVKVDTHPPGGVTPLDTTFDAHNARGVCWLDGGSADYAAATSQIVCKRVNGQARMWPSSSDPATELSAFAASPELLCWGSSAGEVWCWEADNPSPPRSATPHNGKEVTAVAIADDRWLVTGAKDGTVKVVRSNELPVSVGYPVGVEVTALAVAGNTIMVGLADGAIVLLEHERPPQRKDVV
jgi:WD40 repeat protein